MYRGIRIAGAMLAAGLCAGQAHAEPLKLLGTQLELPFAYKVQHVRESYSQTYGLRAIRVYELKVLDGEAKDSTVMVDASYYSPDRLDAGVVQSLLRSEAEKAAADKATRSVQPLQIDGFGFQFVDGALASGDYPQRMLVTGAVNGAIYRVGLYAKDTRPLTPALAERLKAVRLDYPELLRVRSGFDAEAGLAVVHSSVQTPLGNLELPGGVSARMTGSFVQRDGAGKLEFRRRSFGLHKTGFWTIQNLSLSVSCGAEDPDAYAKFIGMTTESDQDAKDRYTGVTAPQPAQLASLPGETASATGAAVVGIRHSDVSRWAARRDGTLYAVQIERLNGSPIETTLSRQLAAAKPECRLTLPFGSDAPLPPAPPAPEPR